MLSGVRAPLKVQNRILRKPPGRGSRAIRFRACADARPWSLAGASWPDPESVASMRKPLSDRGGASSPGSVSAIDPDASPPEVLARGYAELSPDGPDHFPVVNAKLARMNREEPTLTASDLSGLTSRTLVMIGDDDEVTLEHAIAMYRGPSRRRARGRARHLAWAPLREARAVQRDHPRLPDRRPRANHRSGPPRERSLRVRSVMEATAAKANRRPSATGPPSRNGCARSAPRSPSKRTTTPHSRRRPPTSPPSRTSSSEASPKPSPRRPRTSCAY